MPYHPQDHPFKNTPFTPRFNVPETFRECVSYEGQIHYLANLCFDAYEWVEHHKAFYWHYSTQQLNEFVVIPSDSAFNSYEYGEIFDIEIDRPLYTWERPGDILGIRIPCEEDGADAVIFAELVPPKNKEDYSEDETGYNFDYAYFPPRTESYPYKIKCRWLYYVRNYTNEMEEFENRIYSVEKKVESLETRMDTVENRVDTLETKVETLETQVKELQTEVTNLKETIETIQNNENANEATLQAIINKLGGGAINSDGSVTFDMNGTAAIGNINVYSQSTDPSSSETNYLRTHTGLTDHDFWYNNEES